MGITRNWFRRARRKVSRTGNRDTVFLQTNASPTHDEEETNLKTAQQQQEDEEQEEIAYDSIVLSFQKKGKTSILSTKKLGEAASAGSRGVREEAGMYSSSVPAYIGSIAGSGSNSPTSEQIQ